MVFGFLFSQVPSKAPFFGFKLNQGFASPLNHEIRMLVSQSINSFSIRLRVFHQ
jgi:hypothetical protein